MRSIIANILVITGLAAIVAAAGMWSVPAALAVGGVAAVAIGVGLTVRKRRS